MCIRDSGINDSGQKKVKASNINDVANSIHNKNDKNIRRGDKIKGEIKSMCVFESKMVSVLTIKIRTKGNSSFLIKLEN